MAVLKYKDLEKISDEERTKKLKDLKMELTRANVAANKQNAKTKEIKRAISRVLTFTRSQKGKVNK